MSCFNKNGTLLSRKISASNPELMKWAVGPDCSVRPDKTCQYMPYILSPMFCPGFWHKNKPCSIGPYRVVHKEIEVECIEDHGRVGRENNKKNRKGGMKYTLACKHKGVVLSTATANLERLKRWVRSSRCQPIVDFSTTQQTTTLSTIPSSACPKLQAIQAEANNKSISLECVENMGNWKYKLACYINNELVSTKTDTIENLKKWAPGCGQVTCLCQEEFLALDKAKCVGQNEWQCQRTVVSGSCSGYTTQIFQRVNTNAKKKRPETKKRHCEKLAKRTNCNPLGYVPNCGS